MGDILFLVRIPSASALALASASASASAFISVHYLLNQLMDLKNCGTMYIDKDNYLIRSQVIPHQAIAHATPNNVGTSHTCAASELPPFEREFEYSMSGVAAETTEEF